MMCVYHFAVIVSTIILIVYEFITLLTLTMTPKE